MPNRITNDEPSPDRNGNRRGTMPIAMHSGNIKLKKGYADHAPLFFACQNLNKNYILCKHFHINPSTNCLPLNTNKSVACSPTPINFTGILN
jgi:hypothetical protein